MINEAARDLLLRRIEVGQGLAELESYDRHASSLNTSYTRSRIHSHVCMHACVHAVVNRNDVGAGSARCSHQVAYLVRGAV